MDEDFQAELADLVPRLFDHLLLPKEVNFTELIINLITKNKLKTIGFTDRRQNHQRS